MGGVPGDNDPYRVGVVGLGHWATKFDDAFNGDLTVDRAVDVAPISEKRDVLQALDIPDDNYTRIAPSDPLPEDLFGNVDVVHIASPVQAHRRQTVQALEDSNALVVTEKAYGPALEDHRAVEAVADRQPNDTYLHLHYTRKMPTLALEAAFDNVVEDTVDDVAMSFLDGFSEEDADRNWIFHPSNGGIVLDWIHPVEVLVYSCDARFDGLQEAAAFSTTDAYDTDYPTAAELTYDVSGAGFADDATATVRIGKGFPRDVPYKAARFDLGTSRLDISYTSSGVERETGDRGAITYDDGDGFARRLTGPDPYELMADDMVRAVEDGDLPLTLAETREMMDAVQMAND
ncbi:MAG: hypothetical protein ABEI97_03720, partial [Candidatus Nanohaloarchaea archaeon]